MKTLLGIGIFIGLIMTCCEGVDLVDQLVMNTAGISLMVICGWLLVDRLRREEL